MSNRSLRRGPTVSNLVDTVKKLNLSEKDTLMIMMFPGILFGFFPSNFKQLEERMSCSICIAIAEKIKRIADIKKPKSWKHKLPWIRRAWKKQVNTLAQQLVCEAKVLEDSDKEHWGSKEKEKISMEFVGAFSCFERWEI